MASLNHSMEEIQEQPKEEALTITKNAFAKGMCFYKLFWFFIIGCIIGTYYEQVLTLVTTGQWESRQGVLYGPFNPVYGFGMVLMILLLYRVKVWWRVVLYGALIGGAFEYILSYLQELFIHSHSWDYSNHFLQIHGRTTIPFMIFWGLLGFVVVRLLYPPISQLIESVPQTRGNNLTICFMIFFSLNMLLTGVVLLRQSQRILQKEPYTIVGYWIDEVYTDEVLKEIFPNMS